MKNKWGNLWKFLRIMLLQSKYSLGIVIHVTLNDNPSWHYPLSCLALCFSVKKLRSMGPWIPNIFWELFLKGLLYIHPVNKTVHMQAALAPVDKWVESSDSSTHSLSMGHHWVSDELSVPWNVGSVSKALMLKADISLNSLIVAF